jgi:hypothetical protein
MDHECSPGESDLGRLRDGGAGDSSRFSWLAWKPGGWLSPMKGGDSDFDDFCSAFSLRLGGEVGRKPIPGGGPLTKGRRSLNG